ncbi:hypothetical protein DFO61_2624 [Ectopseudomonas oleovorans]|uniref:Uncharacterized protein n=1 Tax=Ectopseudomonas oleovorans TaxID=301 RepID=A0A397NE83_ECTOL|nr:hypothetical protein DFO61_2624 [Pseudomonas oleovorans]
MPVLHSAYYHKAIFYQYVLPLNGFMGKALFSWCPAIPLVKPVRQILSMWRVALARVFEHLNIYT